MSIPLVPLSIGEATAGSIDISDLTTQSLTGTGIFDILMAAVSLHVNQEFSKGRITGKDYATVYLGSVSSVLQASIAYLSAGKEVEKLNAEIGLLRQKTVSELVNTDNDIPAGLGFNNGTTIEGTALRQNDLYTAQTNGFARDAEQKLSKLMVDTWATRRTTDEATVADGTNHLSDWDIGSVITKAKQGIGL